MNEIIKIKISEIDDFKNHPYKVELGDELNDLVESIKLNGLLVPIVVRRKENDRYELLSGHRREKTIWRWRKRIYNRLWYNNY